MNQPEIYPTGDDEYTVIYPTGWSSQCKDLATAEALVTEYLAETQPVKVAYAGGTRHHRPVKVIRGSDGLVKTACGQRGWISENPQGLTPCQKCY